MFVYADYAATAPLKESALKAMTPWLNSGNASSMYSIARDAKRALENARGEINNIFGGTIGEVYFTSGGTESDNWAIKGSVKDPKGTHIITTSIEHHAILRTVEYMRKQGCDVTYLSVDKNGQIDLGELENSIRPETVLVSIMTANNEIGSILPVNKAFEICKNKNKKIICHTDAVQAAGHIPLDLTNVDLMSMSAHKFGGPKGVGALYVRKGVSLAPLLHGGGHEKTKRSGTENIAGIIGMAAALKESVENLESSSKKTIAARNRLIDGILTIPYSHLTGSLENRLPGNASFIFESVEGESLVLGLDMNGICASSGSACSSGSLDPSHVLMAIGLSQEVAHGSLRLSIDETISEQEIDYIIEKVKQVVSTRRTISPLWDEKKQCPTERFWKA